MRIVCPHCGKSGIDPGGGDYTFAHKGCHDQHLIDSAPEPRDVSKDFWIGVAPRGCNG